jgi:hypothetical protein
MLLPAAGVTLNMNLITAAGLGFLGLSICAFLIYLI